MNKTTMRTMNPTKENMNTSDSGQKPWYRHGLVWFVIAIPLFAVISSATIIIISTVHYDDLVVDDYYKRGKQINRVLARSDMATRLGLAARLDLDPRTGVVKLNLSSKHKLEKQHITFKLIHTVFSRKDQAVTLEHLGGNLYRGKLQTLEPGHWNISLETEQWRLSRRIQVRTGTGSFQLQAPKNAP